MLSAQRLSAQASTDLALLRVRHRLPASRCGHCNRSNLTTAVRPKLTQHNGDPNAYRIEILTCYSRAVSSCALGLGIAEFNAARLNGGIRQPSISDRDQASPQARQAQGVPFDA